jgi:hypothetical protein
MPKPNKPEYLTSQEVAAELGFPASWIESKRRAGLIPFVDGGHRTVRYRMSAVKKAIAKLETTGPTRPYRRMQKPETQPENVAV